MAESCLTNIQTRKFISENLKNLYMSKYVPLKKKCPYII